MAYQPDLHRAHHSHRHRAAGFDRAADLVRACQRHLLTRRRPRLTIRDNSGSYVIPAGSQMVTNYTSLSDYTNDVIGSQ